jgi:hypothetical protein
MSHALAIQAGMNFPCAVGKQHFIVRSDEGPMAAYSDGVPYCKHCGAMAFDLTDSEVSITRKMAA